MEQSLKLKIPNTDKIIYGLLNKSSLSSKKLIIFVHGLAGHANEHFLYNAARFFPENGFDTFRFNLYWFEPETRKFAETEFSDHIEDVNTVVSYFKDSYETIYLVGHSLGAHVIIRGNLEGIKAATLWEPSREIKELFLDLTYIVPLEAYIEHSNVDIIVGKKFVDSTDRLSSLPESISMFKKPLKIIGAELAGADIAKNTYYKNANEPKELYIIKGCGHTFDEGNSEKELFNETLSWFEKY